MPSHEVSDDPSALAKFGRLEVVAKLVVEGYMIGQHKSPFKGSSVEFIEHRQYYPGDEVRHIDWRAFGKTGKYYIKEFEEETNLRAYLIVDCSGSMGYGSSTISKFAYGTQLAACFTYLLHRQRDAVGLTTFDTKIRHRIEPSSSPKIVQHINQVLESSKTGSETSLSAVFEKLIPTLKRRSIVILISDFFDDLKALRTALSSFQRHQHEVLLCQVLAPEERDFPFSKPTQFRNLEDLQDKLLVDPHRLRTIYMEQFEKFEQELIDLSAHTGFDLLTMTTSDPYQKALGAYLSSRSRRTR
ncbi:VWA domain containing CoxE-like protein [Thalassoglobus neptunius]|uniref:VWA domain containing CoxE-like protein n=1 Tax=Thalassoglobus neptunius TaxID=1938619 RepID=A0A5C5WP44_9PLAN|nr:DUF58 domain-containing protein [Thalassoglobus neptunius]TWT51592.1 VWA domain containing CoxE-like protein [Thalassoglobus neptunius]